MKKTTISACMIVKDEEELLSGCLDSIKDWVDEIILVDTGSTDKTKEIAKKYGCKIYDHEWKDDFSEARNFSLSKATKDWIFVIDADEKADVTDALTIKKMLGDLNEDIHIISVTVIGMYGKPWVARSASTGYRFFRRSYEPAYVGAVHNEPVKRKGAKIMRVPFKLYHYGYDLEPEVMEVKRQRRIKLCKKLMEEKPDDPKSYYHYARAIKAVDNQFNEKQKEEMVKVLKRGIDLCGGKNNPQNLYIQLLSLLGWVCHFMKNHTDAINYANRALIFKHDYLDAILLLGFAHAYGGNIKDAEAWLKRYLVEQDIYQFSDKKDFIAMEHANDRKLVYKTLIDIENWKEKQPV